MPPVTPSAISAISLTLALCPLPFAFCLDDLYFALLGPEGLDNCVCLGPHGLDPRTLGQHDRAHPVHGAVEVVVDDHVLVLRVLPDLGPGHVQARVDLRL